MTKTKYFLVLILTLILTATFVDGRTRHLDITSIQIIFDKTDAIFTVNYDLGNLPKFYIIIFGGRSLEPDIKSVFSNFNYDIIKMDENKAILRVKNISRYEKGYYFYDSGSRFGQGIPELDLYFPESSTPRILSNVYLFNWDNIPGPDNYNLIKFLKNDMDIKWNGDLKIYKGLDGKSIIGIDEKITKQKLFEIDLDKKGVKSALIVDNQSYDLQVVENNGKFYIFSHYLYSIPNIFYKE